MKREITSYERMGTGYIALDVRGRAVGIIQSVRSIKTADRCLVGRTSLVDGLNEVEL